MEQANEMNPAPATTTSESLSPTQGDVNVIESLKKYNQSQIEKVLCIENHTSTLDCDVVVGNGEATTHENDIPELPEPAAIAKTVVCFLCVNVVICGIFIVYISIFMPLPIGTFSRFIIFPCLCQSIYCR